MSNLLKETIECIEKSGHSSADIIFIGSESSGHSCTWDEFCVLANREYESGYGGQEVANDLIIVFSDGQKMWRGEYDGAEWWEVQTPFEAPAETFPITNLFAKIGWNSLAELNQPNPSTTISASLE